MPKFGFHVTKFADSSGGCFFCAQKWHIWLVVWNMNFIFHNIWDNPSHWPSYFSEGLKPPTSYYIIHYIYTHIHTHWIQVAAEVLGVWLWEVSTTSGSMLVFKYSIWYVETYSHVSDDLFKQECSIYSMMTLYHVYCVYNQVTIYIYTYMCMYLYITTTQFCAIVDTKLWNGLLFCCMWTISQLDAAGRMILNDRWVATRKLVFSRDRWDSGGTWRGLYLDGPWS